MFNKISSARIMFKNACFNSKSKIGKENWVSSIEMSKILYTSPDFINLYGKKGYLTFKKIGLKLKYYDANQGIKLFKHWKNFGIGERNKKDKRNIL